MLRNRRLAAVRGTAITRVEQPARYDLYAAQRVARTDNCYDVHEAGYADLYAKPFTTMTVVSIDVLREDEYLYIF